MHLSLFFIPIISAITCWLLIKSFTKYFFRPLQPVKIAGINFWGIIPRKKEIIVKFLSQEICNQLLNSSVLKDQLSDPDILQKTMPVIETHIDNFLNVKLKEAIPVVSMFVGDRIMNQLKELFINELKELFPSIMSQFISGLSQSQKLENEIVVKLNGIQIETIENRFYQTFKKDLKTIELIFAMIGLGTGILQLLIIVLSFK
ncbi:MAG TPA: hypothetical protein VH396_10325 [Chitinophagaceae bacterium]|jgi:uncharacterized membrane protein YheB (UPF0754 family)